MVLRFLAAVDQRNSFRDGRVLSDVVSITLHLQTKEKPVVVSYFRNCFTLRTSKQYFMKGNNELTYLELT